MRHISNRISSQQCCTICLAEVFQDISYCKAFQSDEKENYYCTLNDNFPNFVDHGNYVFKWTLYPLLTDEKISMIILQSKLTDLDCEPCDPEIFR